jgi:hypothetical protein
MKAGDECMSNMQVQKDDHFSIRYRRFRNVYFLRRLIQNTTLL